MPPGHPPLSHCTDVSVQSFWNETGANQRVISTAIHRIGTSLSKPHPWGRAIRESGEVSNHPRHTNEREKAENRPSQGEAKCDPL